MENAHAETDRSDRRKPKKRRPENLGSLAVISERPESSPEHIGHMLMAAEAKPSARAGKAALEGAGHLLAGRRVETISRNELLELSEHIMIDGSSLRQIYETHLVGERGLRRLMAEYQQGGDLKKALRQEIVEREIDFERDPAMRDIATHEAIQTADNSPTTLNKLLEAADQKTEGQSEETAFFKARARYEAQELHQHKQRRRIVDVAMALVILILLLLIILLSMKRR